MFSRTLKIIISIGLLFNLFDNQFAQDLVINEIMSSNSGAYVDEFNSFPDWIEIYNNSTQTINLSAYALSDDIKNLNKWNLPNYDLESGNHILIAASGRDIMITAGSWETIIEQGDIWKYFLGTQEPPSKWRDSIFTDFSWTSGFSGFGYGDGDDQTIIENVPSIYLRKIFNIEDLSNITQVMFNIDFDDAYIAYLNGIEISRKNIGNPYEEIPFNRYSDTFVEARLYQNQMLDAIFLEEPHSILVNGSNVLAIQVHNSSLSSSDLTAIPFLTLGYKSTESENDVAEEISPLLPTPHSNFKISNGQESIYLSEFNGLIIDSVGAVLIPDNISFGRYPDGSSIFNYFDNPTPGESNYQKGYIQQVEVPQLDHSAGFYINPITVQLVNDNATVKTYFTLDGSDPNENSNEFVSLLNISSTSVVKLKSYSENEMASAIKSYTYFINEEKNLPVISLSTDPKNLWDHNEGIYVMGPNAESNFPFFGANFWQDWEKPAQFEFFEDNEVRVIDQDVSIKIFGGWTRGHPQKSISVFPIKDIDYKIFPDKDVENFSSVVLRNSGNDWDFTMLRDGMISRITDQLNIDNLAYRPAEIYLNGEYWGIHNIREKINLSYISNHYEVDKDKINLLELNGEVIDGTNEEYFQLINYLNQNNLSDNVKYEYVKSQIDIDSFIDYQLLQIFIANVDWPGNNLKFWKEHGNAGKWRWILFDTDFGLGWMYGEDYTHNTLRFALEENGPDWPNPPWSTFILRKLIQNPTFRQKFINRYSDLLNTELSYSRINNILIEVSDKVKHSIPRHSQKWSQFSFYDWLNNLDVIERFAILRSVYLDRYFKEEFNLGDAKEIEIKVQPANAGKVKINSLLTLSYPWKGKYFSEHPIKLKAFPNPGYTFSGWSGGSDDTNDSLDIIVGDWSNIQANFEKDNSHPQIIINEINYNSSSIYDTKDWIELYNNSDEVIDLSEWKLKDQVDSNVFIFPSYIILPSREYLVLCRDTLEFASIVGTGRNIVGNFQFGLGNSGDLIRLYSETNVLIDSVRYDDVSPWPNEADGSGSTLELINPNFDNSSYSNWSASYSFGSPGLANTKLVTDILEEDENILNSFMLLQNYPNPFNPRTVINYIIPNESKISLKVFDLLGNEVAELVNDIKSKGEYSVLFDGSKFTSGIYFYRISAGSSSIVKKMILLK